ncbi:hypothetical protein K7H13_13005 [Qipengyuania citrea]|uniref:hypothetical protein n=1 Tax=Qipengyuania citrea TaxID=225971 RepID=UPI001E46F330|nr:hypothetical protein [Qipengyuania citrea]MCD1591665.1 hypothetical protein [Qipengyuania citrea]
MEVVDTTYQQKAHTSGYFNGVRGFSYNGYGVTGGGGGQIWTSHENVVCCVLRDRDGTEMAMEFPSSLAVRDTAIIRLDLIDQNVIAARNVSGRGSPIILHDESSFYPLFRFRKTYLALAIIGVLVVDGADQALMWSAIGLTLIAPLIVWSFRRVATIRKRYKMRTLMRHVVSAPNPSLGDAVRAGWKKLEDS